MNTRDNKLCILVVALMALVSMLAVPGCSDLGAPLKLLAHGQLSATSLDFGTVVVSGAATRSVVISNSGNAELHGFASVSCPGYSIPSGGGAYTVPPAGQHTVVVRYQPSGVGSSPCALTLGGDLPPVALSGNGALQQAGARCELSRDSLDFGVVAVGGNKLALFRAYSRGTAAVFLDVVATCGDYQVLGGGGPHTLAPGDSITVTVGFVPTAGGHLECAIATGPGCPDVIVKGDATSVSFAAQVRPIFVARFCNSCHIVPMQEARDMVNVTSPSYAPALLIKPFDLAGSVVYGKVTNSGRYGGPMPFGTNGLSAPEAAKIRTWILEGAHDN